MKKLSVIICFLIIFIRAKAQKPYSDMTVSEKKLYNEHIIEGQPDGVNTPVYVRQGYVMKFSEKYRIPVWVAYHIIPDYLNAPDREGRLKKFNPDPDMDKPVKDIDYTGSGYARGHMAPYFAMGGDRNGNGVYADLFEPSSDKYDEQTVLQANYLSNIAPQDQNSMNGPGGPWYALETVIRDKLVKTKGMELNVVVGGIISNPEKYDTLIGEYSSVGIAIPNKFFQVIIYKDKQGNFMTAGFLFPHVKKKSDLPYKELIRYIVPVDTIEKITGFDFLNQLDSKIQSKIEGVDNKSFWLNNGFGDN